MRSGRTLVYLSTPLWQDVPGAMRVAERWVAWVLAAYPHIVPFSAWLVWGATMGDAAGRMRALDCAVEVVQRCDEIWMVGGRITPLMQAEMTSAERYGKRVLDLSFMGLDPPVGRDLRADALLVGG
jgi:hypothetical protein